VVRLTLRKIGAVVLFAASVAPIQILAVMPGSGAQEMQGIEYQPANESQHGVWQQILEDHSSLVDPFSVQTRDLTEVLYKGNSIGYCARINAKNRSGGYGGWHHAAYVNGSPFVMTEYVTLAELQMAGKACMKLSTSRNFCNGDVCRQCEADIARKSKDTGGVWTVCGQLNGYMNAN